MKKYIFTLLACLVAMGVQAQTTLKWVDASTLGIIGQAEPTGKPYDRINTDESWIEYMAMDDAMGRLSPREKRILSLRFFDGRTQMEVAAMVGISQAQVSRLEKNAIRQIKKSLTVS